MTIDEFDTLTIWGPKRRPPRDWDGVTPYLLREGSFILGGYELRAYCISDGTRIINHEDLARMEQSRRT